MEKPVTNSADGARPKGGSATRRFPAGASAPVAEAAADPAADYADPADHGDVLPLPPGLDLLWGRRERGRTGPKPGLTVDAIVDAAMRVADAEGLEAVSMKRVATELGFTTMALYRYVDSKDELLAMMWNASALGLPTVTGDGWRELLSNWAVVQFEAVCRRTWVLQMPMSRPPAGPASLAWVEQALAALADTGLSEAPKMGVIGLLSTYALSEARMQYEEARARTEAPYADYAALLRKVADERTYPALYRAAWSGELDLPAGAERPAFDVNEFRFGLDRILDGVQALIDGQTPATERQTPAT